MQPLDDPLIPKARRWDGGFYLGVLCVLLIAASETCRWLLPLFLRQDLYHTDALQHVFWTYRYADPALFKGDWIADFMSQRVFSPPGWRGLFALLAPNVDAQNLADLIPLVLAAVSWALIWRIGRFVSGGEKLGGAVAVGVALYVHAMHPLMGGFARAWGMPLMLLAVWAILERRLVRLGIAGLLAALFYPPVVIVIGPLAVVVLAFDFYKTRRLPRTVWPMLGLGIIAIAVVYHSYATKLPQGFGPPVSYAEARAMPDFQRGGRLEFWDFGFKDFWFDNQRSGLGVGRTNFILMAILSGLAALLLRGAVPLAGYLLALISLAVFFVAHLTLFKLYLPNRHVQFALPIYAIILLSAAIPWLAKRVAPGLLSRRFLLTLGVCAAVLITTEAVVEVTLYSRPGVIKPETRRPHWNEPDGMAAAYRDIEALPKNLMIAAHPFDADHIPFRARRSVLVNRENFMAYDLGYYKPLVPRMNDTLLALYATDWATVDALADRYGVSVFIVNRERLRSEHSLSFNPTASAEVSRAASLARQNGVRSLVLWDPPADRVLFRHGSVIGVRVDKVSATSRGMGASPTHSLAKQAP